MHDQPISSSADVTTLLLLLLLTRASGSGGLSADYVFTLILTLMLLQNISGQP